MTSISETLGSFLRNEAQILSHLLNRGSSTPILGGFRSQTFSQKLQCEFVLKIADRIELELQKDYIEALPLPFRSLFPALFVLREVPDSDKAVAVMEKLPGSTLHQTLLSTEFSETAKTSVLEKVLTLLSALHRHTKSGLVQCRKVSFWVGKLEERMKHFENIELVRNLVETITPQAKVILEVPITRRWIHGDAQGGNFIVNFSEKAPEVRWIDPLGGSGHGLDDYVYDLSRLFHWLQSIAVLLEEKINPTNRQGMDQYHSIRLDLCQMIRDALAHSRSEFHDPAAAFWFQLYCAYHLSGKLSDFEDSWHQSQIQVALSESLRHATEEAQKLTQRSESYAVY